MSSPRLSHKRSPKSNQRKPVPASSGLKQFVLPRITPALINEALEMEAAAGPADAQALNSALDDSHYGQYVKQVLAWMREQRMDEAERMLAVLCMGTGLGLRLVDLTVGRVAN
jgi:hypothetical protein